MIICNSSLCCDFLVPPADLDYLTSTNLDLEGHNHTIGIHFFTFLFFFYSRSNTVWLICTSCSSHCRWEKIPTATWFYFHIFCFFIVTTRFLSPSGCCGPAGRVCRKPAAGAGRLASHHFFHRLIHILAPLLVFLPFIHTHWARETQELGDAAAGSCQPAGSFSLTSLSLPKTLRIVSCVSNVFLYYRNNRPRIRTKRRRKKRNGSWRKNVWRSERRGWRRRRRRLGGSTWSCKRTERHCGGGKRSTRENWRGWRRPRKSWRETRRPWGGTQRDWKPWKETRWSILSGLFDLCHGCVQRVSKFQIFGDAVVLQQSIWQLCQL